MYVQIWIIKQLGLLFGGERVLRSADLSSRPKIGAPARALAVSVFGRPVCSPMDGLYWWPRQQPSGALISQWQVGRGVHRTPAWLPCCIIWSWIKIEVNMLSKSTAGLLHYRKLKALRFILTCCCWFQWSALMSSVTGRTKVFLVKWWHVSTWDCICAWYLKTHTNSEKLERLHWRLC